MNIIDKLWNLGANTLPFIIVLTVIVFIHEMGHFLIARYNGVQVKTFSIGIGPELCGWTDKKGTRWRLSLLPFGGYVMMLGDDDATSVKADLSNVREEDKSKTLTSKTPFQRMAISFGGPLFNILLTIFITLGMGFFKGIPDSVPKIQEIMQDSPAQKAGLAVGDVILSLNDAEVRTLSQLPTVLKRFAGKNVTLVVQRGEEKVTLPLALYETTTEGKTVIKHSLGVTLGGELIFEQATFLQAFAYSLSYCWNMTTNTVNALIGSFTGKSGAKLGSVFSIGSAAKKTMSQGALSVLNFIGMLSFSLAFFNLLPIPALDGGSIFLNGLETILRRPLSENFIEWSYRIGLGCVALLMLWSLRNDFVHFHFVDGIVNFFKSIFR